MCPLDPQNLPVPFKAGIDTKSDDKQVQANLISLSNATFQSPGEITKRNGFTAITKNISGGGTISKGVGVASFQNELITLDGSNLYSYSPETNTQVNRGLLVPVAVTTKNIVRNANNQNKPDSAYDSVTGLQCFVWSEGGSVSGTTGLRYSILDTNTNAFIVSNGSVASASNLNYAEVNKVGNNFVIVYNNGAGSSLFYRAIDISTPTAIAAPVTIATDLIVTFDTVISGSSLYICYSRSASVAFYSLSSSLVLSSLYSVSATSPTVRGVAADGSGNIWAVYNSSTNFYGIVVNSALNSTVLAQTLIDSVNATNATLIVASTTASIYYEVAGSGSAPAIVNPSTFKNTLTLAGTAGTPSVLMRGVGLASKVFTVGSVNYLLCVYDGVTSLLNVLNSIEPSYFLLNGSGQIVAKVAPNNAGNYYTGTVPPKVYATSSLVYSIPYLFRDNISPQQGVIYFSTGVLSGSFDFSNSVAPSKNVSGQNLLIGSGQVWMYDGNSVVEHGFHVYPENAALAATFTSGGGIGSGLNHSAALNQVQYVAVYQWADNQGNIHRSATQAPALTVKIPTVTPFTFTASALVNTTTLTSVSDFTGLKAGQIITDSTAAGSLSPGTYIVSLNPGASQLTINSPTVAALSGDTLTTSDIAHFSVNIPTCRATNKTGVLIYLYRTQNNGTIFYQIGDPTVNDTSIDYVTIADSNPDSLIIGNAQLYTTGGELPNINAPAVNWLSSFKNRSMYGSPENPTQAGYSKQVLPGTPVEFDSLEFFESVDQNIQRISAGAPLDDKFICFGPDRKFYFVGNGPSPNGENNDFTEAQPISGTTGCTNQASILELPGGLTYQDPQKGIWLLDRSLSEKYIGAQVEAYNQYTITSSKLIRDQNKAVYTLSNGVNLVYDFYLDQWETDIVVSGAVDSTIYKNNFVYLQSDGTLQEQIPNTFDDNGVLVPISLKTGWMSFAGLEGFQRVWEMQILGTYFSPHSLTVNIYTDFASTPSQVVTIPVLTDPGLYQFRIHLEQQKCESIQVEIIETQSGTSGQGFSLSSLAFRVGVKRGLNKLPAAVSY